VKELATAYMEDCQAPGSNLAARTIQEYERSIKLHIVPELGEYNLLSEDLESKFRQKIRNMKHRGAAALAFRVARRMGYWAKECKWIKYNPFADAIATRYRPTLKERRGHFNVQEIEALLRYLVRRVHSSETPPGLRSAAIGLLLLVLTGTRKGEVIGSTWQEWDLRLSALKKASTKTGPEDKPVNAAAREAVTWLQALDRKHATWVCPAVTKDQPVDMTTVFNELRKGQKELFKDKPFRSVHDLRRSFITALKDKDISLVLIAEILRHKTLAVAKYYAQYQDKVSMAYLETGSEWMNEAFGEALAIKELKPVNEEGITSPKIPKKPRVRRDSATLNGILPKTTSRYPSKDELQAMVLKMPVTQIAKQLGVSDKAVEKHCKRHGITKPGRGYWAKKKASSNS